MEDFDYDYDVEYLADESAYLTSDKLNEEPTERPETVPTLKVQSEDLTPDYGTTERLYLDDEVKDEVEYKQEDKPTPTIMTMASEKVVTTNTPVNSVQNLSADQGSWKKPVIIGAACLAAIWFFNQD